MKHLVFEAIFLMAGVVYATPAFPKEGIDYSDGVFIVNEDWYGHQNSTLNYLLPEASHGETWNYRVIQNENPGKELGCTAQYATIWQGRLYIIAKQAKDPGANVTGGRITVADAATMEILCQRELIDPSGKQCDGRGFVGVDKHKGYISTSNGVWIFNLDTMEVERQIEGTENNTGSLYSSQSGSMVLCDGKVFVAHQSLGLIVIDTADDKVTDIIGMDKAAPGAGIGSVVHGHDGNIWVSIAKNISGSGDSLGYLLRVDPETLETSVINLPETFYGPSNSWYAWTPDSFCASEKENALFWSGGKNSWFTGTTIYRYDIDSDTTEKIIDLDADGEGWKLYGCSMRVDPRNDNIYMSLYKNFNSKTYLTRRYTSLGVKVRDYPMIENYWFPSIPFFPESTDLSNIMEWTEETEDNGVEEWYTMSGIRVDISNTPSPGIYIHKKGKTTRKIIVK